MKTHRQDTVRTRNSLLSAAACVFAEKGYRDSTVAEISKRAGTNIAAVNYHFGDKETLYREAWRQSFRESISAHPPDGGIPADAPAEKRLGGEVAALLARITDEANREFHIAYKEIANPTGLLNEVMNEEIAPLRERMENLVRDVLGPDSPGEAVRFCAVSIISQSVIPAFINMLERTDEGGTDSWRIEDIEGYAEHVVAFSLAAMRSMGGNTKKTKGGNNPERP